MNFIYTIIMWGIFFLAATITKNISDSEGIINTMMGFQVFFVCLSLIFAIVCFFYQLSENKVYIETANTIKKLVAEVELNKQKYEEIKQYLIKYFAEDYPKFEKEILLATSEKPAELTALIQAYPKLKSSKVFSELINKLIYLVNQIYDVKKDIEWNRNRRENVLTNTWLLIKPKRYEI